MRPSIRQLQLGRLASLFCVAVFSAIMLSAYLSWLAPKFYYFGFSLNQDGYQDLWLAIPLVFLAAIALPVILVDFSDYFLWSIFYFLYAPTILFLPLQWLPHINATALIVALAVSFHSMIFIAKLGGRRKPSQSRLPITQNEFIIVFFLIYISCLLFILMVFGGSLRLAEFGTDVYDQRRVGADLSAGTLVGYAVGLFSGALSPFLMAAGLTEGRKSWIFIGALGQVLIYAAMASKAALLSAALIPLFYYSFIRNQWMYSYRLGILVVVSCALPWLLKDNLSDAAEGWQWQFVSIILMRTYGLAGAMPGVYAEFFAVNPNTLYSHINVVSLFIHYPYTGQVGQVIGEQALGLPGLNANASFWATDGIAALGNVGVLIIGVVVGASLSIANFILSLADRRLVFLSAIPFVISVTNASFFTAVLTGGGGLLLLLVFLWQEAKHTSLKGGDRSRISIRAKPGASP